MARATKRRSDEATKGLVSRTNSPSSLRRSVAPSLRATGFTLIELMISIALVLLLMIGINQVFKVTGEAVGTSTAISTGVRDARAVQTVMAGDFASMVTEPDAPFLIINSERIAAFRDRKEELGDRDYDLGNGSGTAVDLAIRTIDVDRDGDENAATVNDNLDLIPRAIYGIRNRRIDQIGFFARGTFPRQTGNDGTYIADMSSSEALIWYGHLMQPGPDPTVYSQYTYPGTGIPDGELYNFQTNPNNFYSSQWVLGRMVMLLRQPDGMGEIKDRSDVPQEYIERPLTATRLQPLQQQSRDTGSFSGTGTFQIQYGRYDLAGTTISDFKTVLTTWINANNPPPPGVNDWYEGPQGLLYRFQGSLYPPKPLTSEGLARISPTLLQHCSQFIVEYAGDFLTQDNDPDSPTYGRVQTTPVSGDWQDALQPDNVIDFVVNPNPTSKARSIRWYGYPRDTSSNGSISTLNPNTPPGQPDGVIHGGISPLIAAHGANALCDVVPLRDVAMAANPPPPLGFAGFPFERDIPPTTPSFLTVKANYGARGTTGANSAPALTSRYRCAWGPVYPPPVPPELPLPTPYPKLIRIMLVIDDPTGRIAEGQTFEYVFKVGG